MPGTHYVITSGIVPAVDGALNDIAANVIGNKADTAINTKDDVSAIMRYLKGLMDAVGISTGVGQGLVYKGVVTAVPGANQFTIATLAGLGAFKFLGTNPYYAFVLRDAGGAAAAPESEIQAISAYVTASGAFTAAAFSAAVAVGDEMLILHPAIGALLNSTYGLSALETLVDGIETQTDKLASAAVVVAASASINWNTNTGTSGLAGEDLVTIGGAGVKQKLVKLLINVANCTTAALIEVRCYDQANSVAGERLSYSQVRTTPAQGTPPDIIDIIAQTGGPIELDNAMRIEVYSSTNEAVVLNYEYRLELR